LECKDDNTYALVSDVGSVVFEIDEIGKIIDDDYYTILLDKNTIKLPEEVDIKGTKTDKITYPIHFVAIGEKSKFSIRVKATISFGKLNYVIIPKKIYGEKNSTLTVLTDRLDEVLGLRNFPLKVVYTPFPELFLREEKTVIFCGIAVEKAVKEKEFSKVIGVAENLEEIRLAIEGNKQLKKPVEVGVSYLKEELKDVIKWLKMTGSIPPCVEKFLENIENDRNPYRIRAFLSFFKKFAEELFGKYSWLLKELLDVGVSVTEKNGSVGTQSERIVIPPAFPCLSFAKDYCSCSSWNECSYQKYGDVFRIDVETLNTRNDTAILVLDVVGQGEVRKEVPRGLEVDRIIRKLGARVEPTLLKYYKPLLELEISRALSSAKEIFYPERIRLRIIHYAKEAIISLISENRFNVKEENGETYIILPVKDLYSKIMGEFEKPLTEKVSLEEIRAVIDEMLGAYVEKGQFTLRNGKVRVVFKLPEEIYQWFMFEVETHIPKEHYERKLESAYEIAEKGYEKWQRESELAKKSHGVSDAVIDYMEQDPKFKYEAQKRIKKIATGEETPEDRFENMLLSDDVDVFLYWKNEEQEELPKEVLESFGINHGAAIPNSVAIIVTILLTVAQ